MAADDAMGPGVSPGVCDVCFRIDAVAIVSSLMTPITVLRIEKVIRIGTVSCIAIFSAVCVLVE